MVRGRLRSILVQVRLREFLVDPAAAVVAAPDAAAHQPAGDGPARNDDRPQMPETRPGWHSVRCDFGVARHGHVTLRGIESLIPLFAPGDGGQPNSLVKLNVGAPG